MDRGHHSPYDPYNSYNSFYGSYDSSHGQPYSSSFYRDNGYPMQYREVPPCPPRPQSLDMFAHFAGVVSTRLVIVSILMELSQFQIHNCWGIIKWVIILPTPILDGIVNKVSKGMKGTIMELPIISGNPQVTLKTPTSHP